MWKRGLGSLTLAVVLLSAVPMTDLPADAACSPRLFSELGPAPRDLPPPPAPEPVEPVGAADTVSTPAEAPPPEQPPSTPPPPRCSYVYRLGYPIAGDSAFLSVFGAIREAGERWHAGVDIAAAKLTPVVAVRSGTVLEVNRNGGGDCCWVKIRHRDGWQSLYVHLNNDTWPTDDGRGVGIVRNLEVGDTVAQGQVIGYVGDSGNAEPSVPHLHFELRTPWGESVDPLPSLRRAKGRAPTGLSGVEAVTGDLGSPFVDVAFQQDIELVSYATSIGLHLACDEFGLLFCGDAPADEETATAWIEALLVDPLDLIARAQASEDRAAQADATVDEIETAEQIRFLQLCVDRCEPRLTRSDLAGLLSEADPLRWETVDLGELYHLGMVDACDGSEHPEDDALNRIGLLRMLMRVFGTLETPPCELIS